MAGKLIGVSSFSAKDDRCGREQIMFALIGPRRAADPQHVRLNPAVTAAALSVLFIAASFIPLPAQAGVPQPSLSALVHASVPEDAVILRNQTRPDAEAPQAPSQPELPRQLGPGEQNVPEPDAVTLKLSIWEDSREPLVGSGLTPEWAKPGSMLGSLGTVIASEAAKEWIAPGVDLLHLALLTTSGWHKIHMVAVDPASGVRLDALMPQHGITGRASVSRLVAASGALVGINADFYDTSGSGAPLGFLADDGKVVSSPREDGVWASIGLARDGVELLGTLGFTAKITAPGGESFPVYALNKPHPKGNAITLYDQHWGPTTPAAPAVSSGPEAPGMQLAPPGAAAVPEMLEMEIQDGVVKAIHIPGGGTRLAPGVLVARATGKGAEFVLKHFQTGTPVEVSVGLAADISAYDAVISGKPILVRDGVKCQGLSDHRSISGHLPAPRTLIGANEGRVFLMAIDGRAPGVRGMTLEQAADLALAMGLDFALNLDGGGSTSMAVRRDEVQGVSVVNRLSEGSERAVPYAVGVVSKEQPEGTPARLRLELVSRRGILAPPWTWEAQDAAGRAVPFGVLPVSSVLESGALIRPGSDRPWQDPATLPEIRLVQGDSVLVEVKPLDLFGNLVDAPHAPVTFSVRDEVPSALSIETSVDSAEGSRVLDVSGGVASRGVITAVAPGTAVVIATLPAPKGPISAEMRVRVIGQAVSLAAVPTGSPSRPHMSGAGFRVFAVDGSGYSAEVPPDMVQWTVRSLGNASQLVAQFQGAEVVADAAEERQEAQPFTGVPFTGELLIDGIDDPASWSLATYPEEVTADVSFCSQGTAPVEGAVPAQSSVSAQGAVPAQGTAAVQNAVPARGAVVSYRFEGTEKTRAAYLIPRSPLPVPGEPVALGLWVYGDGKGPWVRAKVVDSSGKSFPVDFPRADWLGWKYVQADLPAQAVYPVYVARVYAVEFDKTKQYSGTIGFAGLTAVYGPQRQAPPGSQSPGRAPSRSASAVGAAEQEPIAHQTKGAGESSQAWHSTGLPLAGPASPAEMTIALRGTVQGTLATAVLDLRQDMAAAARAEAWRGFIGLLESALSEFGPGKNVPSRPVVIVTGADLFASAPDLELFSKITQRLASLGIPVVVVHGAVWNDEVVRWDGVTFVSYPKAAKGSGKGILLDIAEDAAGLSVQARELSAAEGPGQPGYHLLFAGDHAGKVE